MNILEAGQLVAKVALADNRAVDEATILFWHETIGDREVAEAVGRALLDLSESHRAVLVLRHYENLKFREIAAVLAIPEGTVKSRMAEALTQLAGRLATVLDDRPASSKPTRERILL